MTLTPSVPIRSTIRKKVADLLTAELVGAGLPVETVYDHQVADFDKQSPVIVVTSAGSEELNEAQVVSYIDIHVFVAYSAADEEGNILWTEAESEDAIDLISQMVISVLVPYRDRRTETDPEWEQFEPDGRTDVDPVLIGAINYRHEVISYGFLSGNVA